MAEETLDKSPPPESLADGASCLTVPDPSTERNWWFGDLRIESGSDDEGKEDFLGHSLTRFGGRTTKLKSYSAALAGGAVRYAGVIQDNGFAEPTGTGTGGNPVLKKLDAAFINRMKRWGLPGGALAVVKNGQLIFARGYGHSNLTTGRLVQPDDLFRLASVSKPINQALLLRLLNNDKGSKPVHTLDGGDVTLDTKPFGEIFDYTPPALAGGCDIDGLAGTGDTTGCHLGHIRIRDLMYHTSWPAEHRPRGHSGHPQNFSYDIPSAFSPQDWVSRENYWHCLPSGPFPCALAGPFVKPPGAQYVYMNAEYQILLAVVEKLWGCRTRRTWPRCSLRCTSTSCGRLAIRSCSTIRPDVIQTIPYANPDSRFSSGSRRSPCAPPTTTCSRCPRRSTTVARRTTTWAARRSRPR